jgi:hypothetical protein
MSFLALHATPYATMTNTTLTGTSTGGAPPSFDLPPGAAAQVTTSLAAILLGYTFACVLYGAGSVQAFVYFRVSPRDGTVLKTSVRLSSFYSLPAGAADQTRNRSR